MLILNSDKGCMDYISPDPLCDDDLNLCSAFEVVKILRSLDRENCAESLIIEVNDHNFERYTFSMPTSDIHDEQSLMGKLAQQDLFIPSCYKRCVPYYLCDGYKRCKERRLIEYTHTQLGWYEKNGQALFLYDENQCNGVQSVCARKNFDFCKGNADTYEQFLRDIVLPVPTLALGLALGYSAVVVSRLKDEYDLGTVIVNLCGASSTGKTTIEQLLVSPFACPIPKNGDGLIHTFHATTNALYASLEGINGLPIVLDDVTTNPYINLSNLIYTLSTGQGRSRCNGDGDLREMRPSWSGVIVISSETPIQDDGCKNQGLQVRVLQTQGITWTPDAPTAELIKRTVQKNYGHTGKQFADFVAKIPLEKLCALFEYAQKNVRKLMVQRDNLSDRLELKYSAIWLTIYLLRKCFGYDLNPQALTAILVKPEQDGVVERDISLKALNAINDFVLANYSHFVVCDHTPQQEWQESVDNSKNASGVSYGTIVLNGSVCDVFIPNEKVDEILRSKGINEVATVKKRWRDNGVIKCDSNRLTVKRGKGELRRRCIQFVYPRGLKTDIPDDFYGELQQYIPVANQELSVDTMDWNATVGIDEIFGDNQDE